MQNIFFNTRVFSIDAASLLMRMVFGGLMIVNHGIGKIERLSNEPVKFMSFAGLSPEISLLLVVFAEVGCAALLLIGLATRPALLVLIFAMLVAIFSAHFGDPFQKMESAIMYLFAFIILFIIGPGKYSSDAMLKI